MTIYTQTLGSIVVLAAIILLIVSLRRGGLLDASYGTLFADLVTKLTLPATIFYALSHAVLEWKYVTIVAVMFAGELLLLLVARLAGALLRLAPEQTGSFLLASVFGSSALLGYALVAQVFPHNSDAMAEAVFVSELGVGLPLFTVGVFVAMYYGKKARDRSDIFGSMLSFFRSPIFIAIVAGTAWSILKLPLQGPVMVPVFEAVHVVAQANTFLVTLLVGVSLRFDSLRPIAGIVFAALVIKLALSPLACTLPAYYLRLEPWQLQVLLIESAMPSAMLSVALAKRYGCDAGLASKLVFATLLLSTVSVAVMMRLMG
jgi:malate permease and related proteins